MATRRYIVYGRVQGVGFRWFVDREARIIGLAGWVRNNPDGNLEVLASGTEDQLAKLKMKLKQGPRASRVDEVVEEDASHEVVKSKSFQIEGAW